MRNAAKLDQPLDSAGDRLVLYASTGSALVRYSVDVPQFALGSPVLSATLPASVQYACADHSGRHIYVVSSNGGPGRPGNAHYVNAFAVEADTGTLISHGEAIPLRARPIHVTVDRTCRHLLIVYTEIVIVTVFPIEDDGSIGNEVEQSPSLDAGKFAHQLIVMPSNRSAIVVARGNDAGRGRAEDPGALKLFKYNDGVLSNWATVAPRGGYGFGPRNVALDPAGSHLYVSLERQNKLLVFGLEGDLISAEPGFEQTTLLKPENLRPKQMAGALHVHPKGRFVYLANRAFGVCELDGEPIHAGGENTIAVYRIAEHTGEPTLIQSVDTHGIYPRTFSIDPSGRMMIVGNIRRAAIRQGTTISRVKANLSVFSISDEGTLTHMRSYELENTQEDFFWSALVRIPTVPDKTID